MNYLEGVQSYIPTQWLSNYFNPKTDKTIPLFQNAHNPTLKISAKSLKTKAVAISGVKIAAETAVSALGRLSGLLIGSVLVPVNLAVAGANVYDLAKNHSDKSKKDIAMQSGIIAGNVALLTAGVTLIKTYFATSSIKAMMKSSSMHFAKIAGATGLFILGAVHIGNIANAISKLSTASEKERKDLLLDILHNFLATAGLVLLGLIMLGVLSASVASPFGWMALTLLLSGLLIEVVHDQVKARAIEDKRKT